MKFDVVLCSMGTSYKGYCSNMSRTILIDPPAKVRTGWQPEHSIEYSLTLLLDSI